jgi:hypothetical protein
MDLNYRYALCSNEHWDIRKNVALGQKSSKTSVEQLFFAGCPCSIEIDIFKNVKTVLLTRELKRPVIPLLFRFSLHPLIGLLHHPFATE